MLILLFFIDERNEKMAKEMININANLLKESTFGTFTRSDEEVQVVNFALSKGYGKGREYINCAF